MLVIIIGTKEGREWLELVWKTKIMSQSFLFWLTFNWLKSIKKQELLVKVFFSLPFHLHSSLPYLFIHFF